MENSSKSRRATKHTVPILWVVNITRPRVDHIQQLCSLAHAVTPKPSLTRWRVQYVHDSGVDLGPLGLEWWTQELMRCVCICGVFFLCPVCLCITVLWHADLVCVVSVTGPCCDGSEGPLVWCLTAVDDGPGTFAKFGYAHIHSRSMASRRQRHFLRSNTQTWEREERLLWLMACTF